MREENSARYAEVLERYIGWFTPTCAALVRGEAHGPREEISRARHPLSPSQARRERVRPQRFNAIGRADRRVCIAQPCAQSAIGGRSVLITASGKRYREI